MALGILNMCTYKSLVFGAKTLEIILVFISGYQAHELLLQMLVNEFFGIFTYTVQIMLNIKPQIEKIVYMYTSRFNKCPSLMLIFKTNPHPRTLKH